MASKKKSWIEKLYDSKDLPKVVNLTDDQAEKFGGRTLAIASPKEVYDLMNSVPKGKVTTINNLREAIALKHHADKGCPITTGIFAWIAANAAEEMSKEGRKKTLAWWRTVKLGGDLNPKYPGGAVEQAKRLQAEGIKIFRTKTGKWKVQDMDKIVYKVAEAIEL